jgi:hypothetical protein
MSQTDFLVASFAALFLFIHGLQSISLELQMFGLPVLRPFFERYAKRRVAAFLIGALTTAIVQSSSAVSAIACALVNSHALRFRAALAILIGANVGTTATAWLVAFKLTSLGADTWLAEPELSLSAPLIRPHVRWQTNCTRKLSPGRRASGWIGSSESGTPCPTPPPSF